MRNSVAHSHIKALSWGTSVLTGSGVHNAHARKPQMLHKLSMTQWIVNQTSNRDAQPGLAAGGNVIVWLQQAVETFLT